MARRRVVVTGLGVISPVGIGVAETWQNIVAGKSGIGRITRFDPSAFACQVAGEVKVDGSTVIFRPAARLEFNTAYAVTLAAGVRSYREMNRTAMALLDRERRSATLKADDVLLAFKVRPAAAAGPDPGKVFAELMRPYRGLNDYTVKIHVKVDIPDIRVRDFSATLYFKKPDKFHVETRRFAPIPRNLGVFNDSSEPVAIAVEIVVMEFVAEEFQDHLGFRDRTQPVHAASCNTGCGRARLTSSATNPTNNPTAVTIKPSRGFSSQLGRVIKGGRSNRINKSISVSKNFSTPSVANVCALLRFSISPIK